MLYVLYFVFNVTATPRFYTYVHTLSLHHPLPIPRLEGTFRHTSLRRDDLDARFPGLLDHLIAAARQDPAIAALPDLITQHDEPGRPKKTPAAKKPEAAKKPAPRKPADRKSTRLNSSH